MPLRSEMNAFEEDPMDDFEDVDIDSCDHYTQIRTHDGQDVSHPIDGPANNAEARDSQARRLGAEKLRVPSEEAYQQAFVKFETNTGTLYPCNQSDLDVHNTGAFQEPNNRPFVSAMDATREVMLHNHITRKVPLAELIAIDNLRETVNAVEKRMEFGPDLAIKAFADLDLVFFGGRLRDNIRVQWARLSDHPKFANAPENLWGLTSRLPEQGKSLIRLNADYLLRQAQEEDPLRAIFGILLHEMCHAYQVVRREYARFKRRGHDEFFGTMIAVVHKRAVRVLGLWAIRRDELYRQYHFFPGEQTAKGRVVEWVMDVVLDVDDRLDVVAGKAERGFEAVKRWLLAEKVAVG